ncbi:SDR family oxidoreductase [Gordonia terrae]|uniref:SDR family NAD(P)-dependent oxidoreductase n=1 Tax=Gordonia terrae TaxID=2055 RepID=UPI00200B2D6D|nr:SDR family oxidoreductase [Gordonia terrae]UPW08068.1 SDR family oxidoreductase [Gordonia terrae]
MTNSPRRTAIVTGAAQGIGEAEARALVAAGLEVILNDVDAEHLRATVDALGGPAHAIAVPGDIADPATVDALIDAATGPDSVLDTVVNNAAVLRTGMVFDIDDSDWDVVLGATLTGTFRLSRAAARHWRDHKGGRRNLVLTTSRAAILANPGQTAYAAAKAGVAVMAQTLARELRPYGVQVNAIAPRAYTRMMRDGVGEFTAAAQEEWSPDHIGRFVAFLTTPEADGITGQVFVVHGPRAQLVRTWQVLEPVEFRFDEPAGVGGSVAKLFAEDERTIADFMVDDLPLADPTAPNPFAVNRT